MRCYGWILVLLLSAGSLGAGPAWSAPPKPVFGLKAEITVRSGGKLNFRGMCVAERCAICNDLVSQGRCRNPVLQLRYIESDTTVPLNRLRAINFHEKAPGNKDFYPATLTLADGKEFDALVRIRDHVIPVSFCGVNDIGTISCLSAMKIKRVIFR